MITLQMHFKIQSGTFRTCKCINAFFFSMKNNFFHLKFKLNSIPRLEVNKL